MPKSLPAHFSLKQNSNICILRLSAIGDVCHAASMVTRIRRTRPDVRLTWVIGKIEHALVSGMDGVDFIVFDKTGKKQAVNEFKAQISQIQFDALCIMQVALRANWVSRHIKAPIRLGFDYDHSKEGHSLFINKRISPLQHPHVLEGFQGFADALGIPKMEQLHWDIPLSNDDIDFAQRVHSEYGEFIAICPAASKAERNWPSERYAQVAKYCLEKGIQPIICGGPGQLDRQLADEIVYHLKTDLPSLVGKTSLKQLQAVLAKAKVVIAPDTGPAHMATTVNTPVIGLYAHSNPRRTGPYLSAKFTVNAYDQHIQQQTGKTWQSLKWGTRAKGDDLMCQIEVKDVIEKLELLTSTIPL